MPSLSTYKKYMKSKGDTVADMIRNHSDFAMEETWDRDLTSKVCYIYDYFHDDDKEHNYGMTYENTTKTKIDAKFQISNYGSLSKDQPEVHIMFRPSQKLCDFNEDDELYYLEEYRKKYHREECINGLYIDIPDKQGVYHKWMICLKDVNEQFQKYFVLPCGYNLQWIRNENGKRIKQSMWCVLRSQSSYKM